MVRELFAPMFDSAYLGKAALFNKAAELIIWRLHLTLLMLMFYYIDVLNE